MKTSHKIAAGAFALSAMAGMAHAQATSTGTGTGTVTIVQPITVTSTATLNFGRVNRPLNAGNIIISTAGAQSFSNSELRAVGTQTPAAAGFMVSGDGAGVFSIAAPSSFNMLSGTTGTIAVTTTASASAGTLSGSAGSAGTSPFTVGGTAALGAAQAMGAYTGNFTVVVSYN